MAAETFLDAVVEAVEHAGAYNRNDQAPPAAVLWLDEAQTWQPLIGRLRDRLPLVALGDFAPQSRQGPAIWIRAELAQSADDAKSTEATQVVYLPGVSRERLRAVEDCAQPLRPLAEVQYRSAIWLQRNSREWTPTAFLRSRDGLALDMAADNATRDALHLALSQLADVPLRELAKHHLDAEFFHALLNPDEVKSLLEWLNDPSGFRQQCSAGEWQAFLGQCRQTFDFDPERDTDITAAGKLGQRQGGWLRAWGRFAQAPRSYPRIPDLLQRGRPGDVLFTETSDSWPQDNRDAEAGLRSALTALNGVTPVEARAAINKLETDHGQRRGSVWAALGEARLARALAHLVTLAQTTSRALVGSTTDKIAHAYYSDGWRADAAVCDALASVHDAADVAAVSAAVRAVYLDWADAGARLFQQAAATSYVTAQGVPLEAGTCLLFVDGLRLDAGQMLAQVLRADTLDVDVQHRLASLPSVTETGKPSVTPIAAKLRPTTGFDVAVPPGGTKLNAAGLRKVLRDTGVQALDAIETGDPTGTAWTEFGDVDKVGHNLGLKLAGELAPELRRVAGRITDLLDAGWQRVTVVTDHGWLLMPGGLPKIELPEHLTEDRKGRCARLRTAAQTDQPVFGWTWDEHVRIATPPGVGCYMANREYEHGGVSPQECVTPVLQVAARSDSAGACAIDGVKWIGLRCRIDMAAAPAGSQVDVRTWAGDASSSLVAVTKAVSGTTEVSLIVEDDSHEGEDAFVVVVAASGAVLAQVPTKVGG